MAEELVNEAIERAGLTKAFEVLDKHEFSGVINRAKAYDALANGSFYRFLESIIRPGAIPATWQKLANMGWSDDEITGLIDGNIIKEDPTTLMSVINSGALTTQEFNEFANYPNQEVDILYYTKNAKKILGWLQEHLAMPKIGNESFTA